MTTLVLSSWAGVAVIFTALWWRQVRTKNATSVDAAWCGVIGILAIGYAVLGDGDAGRRALVAALGALWAVRLLAHLVIHRVLGGRAEDGRYQALRARWGPAAMRNFFFLYQAQAAAAVLFSLPLAGAMRGGPLGPVDALGVLVWVVAVIGETVSDRQLARFRADPANRGAVCRVGLWRYSRHPNYFFEWVHWWAYVLIGRGAPLTWVGPVAMLLFLYRLTGIPHTERQALQSRGDRYRDYQRTTSAFFPWVPRELPR